MLYINYGMINVMLNAGPADEPEQSVRNIEELRGKGKEVVGFESASRLIQMTCRGE
jgi:hypothetical protein